jgi:SAM-dependent methyltransferase
MGRWSRVLASAFIDFAGVRGDDKVLDVGCGTGSLPFALADRRANATIVGVDALETSLDFARAKDPDPSRISFELGDACNLPYVNRRAILPPVLPHRANRIGRRRIDCPLPLAPREGLWAGRSAHHTQRRPQPRARGHWMWMRSGTLRPPDN